MSTCLSLEMLGSRPAPAVEREVAEHFAATSSHRRLRRSIPHPFRRLRAPAADHRSPPAVQSQRESILAASTLRVPTRPRKTKSGPSNPIPPPGLCPRRNAKPHVRTQSVAPPQSGPTTKKRKIEPHSSPLPLPPPKCKTAPSNPTLAPGSLRQSARPENSNAKLKTRSDFRTWFDNSRAILQIHASAPVLRPAQGPYPKPKPKPISEPTPTLPAAPPPRPIRLPTSAPRHQAAGLPPTLRPAFAPAQPAAGS